jgi:dienelactone hydrolase
VSHYPSFEAMFTHVVAVYHQGDYEGVYAIITREEAHFPDNADFLRLIRSMLAARTGRNNEALALLADLIAGGYWLGERQWTDTDFDSIRDTPEFRRLRPISDERRQQAQAQAKPELFTFAPGSSVGPLPVLLALHGNQSRVSWHQKHWQGVAEQGWLVALPQSSQVGGLDADRRLGFVWDDEPKTEREVCDHYAVLQTTQPIDGGRVVLGGFSRGAEMAARLALTGAIPARGFVAVCPGGPYSQAPDLWGPIIEQARGRDLRGYVIVGGQDASLEGGQTLATLLRAAGIPCELEEQPDMGHDYPADFPDRLHGILSDIVEA